MDARIARILGDTTLSDEQKSALREVVTDAVTETIAFVKKGKTVHERFVQHVVMHAVDAIIGVENGERIFFWNRGAEATFGYTQDEVLDRTVEFLWPADARRNENALLRERILRDGFVRDHHTQLVTRDGRAVMASMSVTLLRDEADEILGTIAIIRDMTEMRQLERQVIQNEKLALLGQIAAGIAHEMGTPLNIISGVAEVLLLDRPAGHSEREDLETIIGQTDRIANLIRELLAFARPQPLRFERIEMGLELLRAVSLLRGKAEKLDVAITVDVPAGLPQLRADPHHMQQVFLNLLVNAIDALATVEDGRARRIGIEARSDEKEIRIRISDTGPGMKPELLARVFDPFVTTKDVGKGTGLGLAVCRRIVEEHGGSITAESTPGEGSVFTVVFALRRLEET